MDLFSTIFFHFWAFAHVIFSILCRQKMLTVASASAGLSKCTQICSTEGPGPLLRVAMHYSCECDVYCMLIVWTAHHVSELSASISVIGGCCDWNIKQSCILQVGESSKLCIRYDLWDLVSSINVIYSWRPMLDPSVLYPFGVFLVVPIEVPFIWFYLGLFLSLQIIFSFLQSAKSLTW